MNSSTKPFETSVVIVTYQGAPWISRCLSSLTHDGESPHIVVVDNGSTDETHSIVEGNFPSVQLVKVGKNLGFGRGNNIGIRIAIDRRSKYIFLLNQDAYSLPNTVRELGVFLDLNPEFGVCSPLHCSPDEKQIDSRSFRGYLQRYAETYLTDACMGRLLESYQIHGINAAAWFVRSEVFLQAGGFDPLFFMYGEDDDLLERWKYHHFKFALVPASRIVHLRQSASPPNISFRQDVSRRAERRRSYLLNEVKKPIFSTSHALTVLFALGVVQPVFEGLIRRDARDFLANMVAFLRVTFAFRSVMHHRALTAKTGSHFL